MKITFWIQKWELKRDTIIRQEIDGGFQNLIPDLKEAKTDQTWEIRSSKIYHLAAILWIDVSLRPINQRLLTVTIEKELAIQSRTVKRILSQLKTLTALTTLQILTRLLKMDLEVFQAKRRVEDQISIRLLLLYQASMRINGRSNTPLDLWTLSKINNWQHLLLNPHWWEHLRILSIEDRQLRQLNSIWHLMRWHLICYTNQWRLKLDLFRSIPHL